MRFIYKKMLQLVLLVHIVTTNLSCASVITKRQSLSIPLPIQNLATEMQESSEVCGTLECIKTATQILENMDTTINPCDDFYKFACGGYIAKHSIPDEKTSVGVFSDVREELNRQLKELLDREVDDSQPKFVKMIKDFYYSCMNLESIEEFNSEPLKNVLNSFGGWPVVQGESWDDSKFDWMEAVFNLRKLGFNFNILVDVTVSSDFKNNTANIIGMDQTNLGMSDRSYLIKGLADPATAAYFNLMVKSANKLGANELTSETELMDALKFEMTLANYTAPREQRRNYTLLYNKYTIRELKEMAPQVDWLKYLNGVIDGEISDPETVIVIVSPGFIKKISELIVKTDKRTIANYMMWRVVKDSLSSLSKDWRDMGQEYVEKLTGSTKEQPRFKQCLKSLSSSMGIALSSYYVKNYFQAESKIKADEIVSYLRQEFLVMLENLDWMDESTKIQAKDKANAMTSFIGYPQELSNDSLVMEHYANLTIKDNYFINYFNLRKFNTDYRFSKLRKRNIKGDWKKHATVAVVNAFYQLIENSIDFPAGILQQAFFNKDRPHYMNFGGIGYVIGHEITHGFDDRGRQFDKEGNNKNWWDQETDKHFREKTKCIVHQYGNYTAENGMKLNGINTQGENIADNGGMKQAYLAYHSWVKDNGPEPKLPGLDYSPRQLFWISAANVWCNKQRPQNLKNSIISGVHSPSPFRIIGPLSNFADFAKDFQCQLGSAMNPEHKCKVW